jgi:hypothetical protein
MPDRPGAQEAAHDSTGRTESVMNESHDVGLSAPTLLHHHADDVAVLVAEVEAEFGRVDANRTAAHSTALDPTTPARLIPRARGDIFELDFKADRLSRALTELRAKHEAARVQVEEARRRAELATVTNERDAIAAEINDRYPVLAGEIADLLARVRANDARTTALGLDRAECVARGIPNSGYLGMSPVHWLVEMVRLPVLDPLEGTRGEQLWPASSRP